MIDETLLVRDVWMYVDFHGHSRMKNLFMFGCTNAFMKQDVLKERIFPLLMHKACPHFDFDYCKFDVQQDKETTARVVVRQEYNQLNSFTMECSVSGPTRGKLAGFHFNIPTLLEMGAHFCQALFDFASDKGKINKAIAELKEMYPSIDHVLHEDDPTKSKNRARASSTGRNGL
mmetsp:Transcript_29493/g.44807  ORF Transcript_29493/g.44807 Transcript_29493/m.44807 type:complete len:174 (+) Transcript_29493:1561-2082(+)|eukprot:CAMPEP_0170481328 /NCGR_PEP_ID=MMETSP0208-20121228/1811_1 /TAXON_ID=197538 /ORGANISM="Strombidium inclinatum, Strain S3" /LENGTH=173 /DNA_ID=CAMNT_0010754011 /DNA_START=1560 /DNA_END=2081 /DNA_ORIENTATION=-